MRQQLQALQQTLDGDLYFDDLLLEDAVVAIEWPDRLDGIALERAVRVVIDYDGDDARNVSCVVAPESNERVDD